VVFRDPSGKQRKRFAPTFDAARDLKSELPTDIKRGEYRDDARRDDILTFEDYGRLWVETYEGRNGIREEARND